VQFTASSHLQEEHTLPQAKSTQSVKPRSAMMLLKLETSLEVSLKLKTKVQLYYDLHRLLHLLEHRRQSNQKNTLNPRLGRALLHQYHNLAGIQAKG
jgi:hypothetical protein